MIKWLSVLLSGPSVLAYSVFLFPASDFSKAPAEELPGKVEVHVLQVEDFEDNQLIEGLRTTLTQSTSPDASANAWDGGHVSTEVNSALFEIDLPGVRVFGAGFSDNDFGRETLSINGGWPVRLSSFPNYNSNGQGKAFYLLVAAEQNDPDLRSVSIAKGYTIALDHVILGRGTLQPADEGPRRPAVVLSPQRQIQNMAERIRRQQLGAGAASPQREGELVANGGFEEVAAAEADGIRGQFGEPMFAPGSTRLTGWTIQGSMVGLRENPPSPAGGMLMELGPRQEPGAISQQIKTEPGSQYELTFLAAGGRNEQIKVRVGENEQTINRGRSLDFERVRIPFRATGPETELVISGVGNEGFGPMIDAVSILPAP